MKIVILSDTHGNFNGFFNVVNRNDDADLFLHLGDGYNEYLKIREIFKDKTIYMVKGNCDFFDLPQQKILDVEGKKLFACHGDKFNVKMGLDEYIKFAKSKNFNIIVYGHTHIRFIHKEEDLCIINPGSLTLPRKFGPSYCVLYVERNLVEPKIIEYL